MRILALLLLLVTEFTVGTFSSGEVHHLLPGPAAAATLLLTGLAMAGSSSSRCQCRR
jgi:hypothetical protein